MAIHKILPALFLACCLCFAGHASAFAGGSSSSADDALLRRLILPEGFSISLYAGDLPGVRMMLVTAVGDLILSQPRLGRISLIKRGGEAAPVTLLDNLKLPHGLALKEGWLYVAETNAIGRVRFDAVKRATEGAYERIVKDIPGGGRHFTRSLKFGPDGFLYLSIGSSCNVCAEHDPKRAAIMRFNADGSGGRIYATGLRNSVGFDWNPDDGGLYATDAGRDLLGDDTPPDELNRIEKGGFYGWPYAYGQRVPDPQFGHGHAAEIAASIPPVYEFPAHVTPLGIRFIEGDDLPLEYRHMALVALHGSWNRSHKAGYKVVALHWGAGGKITAEDFLTGFLAGENTLGRPVAIAEGPDGAIYISDDMGGRIFRITYSQPQPHIAALDRHDLKRRAVNW